MIALFGILKSFLTGLRRTEFCNVCSFLHYRPAVQRRRLFLLVVLLLLALLPRRGLHVLAPPRGAARGDRGGRQPSRPHRREEGGGGALPAPGMREEVQAQVRAQAARQEEARGRKVPAGRAGIEIFG